MLLKEIINNLNLEVVSGYTEENEEAAAKGVYVCDLLSLVMSKAREKNVWITIQTHLNIVAVATLLDLSAIIIAEDMDIDEDAIKKSEEVKIPIFRSNLSSYEIASKLHDLGL